MTNIPTFDDFKKSRRKGKKAFLKFITSLEINKYTVNDVRRVLINASLFESEPIVRNYLIPRLRSILYPAKVETEKK